VVGYSGLPRLEGRRRSGGEGSRGDLWSVWTMATMHITQDVGDEVMSVEDDHTQTQCQCQHPCLTNLLAPSSPSATWTTVLRLAPPPLGMSMGGIET
jgi:hypothetical protein